MHTDGAARGNPGPAGIGVVLKTSKGERVETIARGIGWATNNAAEYEALIEGLRLAQSHGVQHLEVFMDSLLVVEQMRGKFKVKHQGLRPLHSAARQLASEFEAIEFHAVLREKNSDADLLANEGIDFWLEQNPDARPPERPQRELF